VYVDRYFPAAAKTRMQEMVKNIKLAMKDTITELPWMGQATREKALAKLASLEPQVGYPDAWRPYTGLKLDAGSHFANFEMTERWSVRDRLGEVGKPVDRNRWGMTTPTSNAYYSAIRKEIVFPAGILIPPMFNLEADDAVNYGAIGVVIGHEISHAFDDQGSQYDADGRLKNWWTPEDRKLFLEKAECVVDQFNNYFIEPGVAHNGKLVLGESIGDLAGARIAFRAYMKSLEGKPRPPVIGGFTPEQRFFLSWGQSRGDSTRLETQRLMVVTDPHPVAKWRVNGPLSNLPEFQKAFGCEAGNGMVRSGPKRCDVW
jgi:endothelin-converting enzyme/putative endopeptidase